MSSNLNRWVKRCFIVWNISCNYDDKEKEERRLGEVEKYVKENFWNVFRIIRNDSKSSLFKE